MLSSLVDSSKCAHVKKRVYMPRVADEYNSSSQPLNAVVLASILSMMSPPHSSKKLREGYIVNLAREGGVSPCALMLGLLYIKRLSNSNPDYVNLVSPRDLFLVSMVVASKYMNDEGEMEALTNSDWAKLGCMTKTTLDDLERNFLSAIDWRLYVPLEEYYTFVNSIEARIAMEQASRRGWFTYTDLTAVWEATDVQSSMVLATKQTAKVATRGAALYLMCVATLFAASGTLPLTQDLGFQLSTPTGAVGRLAGDVLGHTHAPPPVQQMIMNEYSATPNFDHMETMHRKKISDNIDQSHCSILSHDNQILSGDPLNASTSDYLLMGGCDRNQTGDGKFKESEENGVEIERKEGEFSPQTEQTSVSANHETKKTWSKFEDGLLLLLNLVASITLSSAPKPVPSSSKSATPLSSRSHQSSESLPTVQTTGTFTPSLSTPRTPDGSMVSETGGLQPVRFFEQTSCYSCQQNARRNLTTYWSDASNNSWSQAFFVGWSSEHLTLHHNPRSGPRGKSNPSLHCSQREAVAVDTTKCVCTSRSSESVVVNSSPKLNTGQVAVDLHWQNGGTGENDQSLGSRHFNSTPLSLGVDNVNATRLTLTENLLLYANSLLTMAF